MITQEKYQEILPRFCHYWDANIRRTLQKPFFDGKNVCATDCYWLIRVKPEAYGLIPAEGPKSIELNYLPKPLILSVKRLDKAIRDNCHFVDEEEEVSPEVRCEECCGTGEVEWEYRDSDFELHTHDFECPICDGTGVKEESVKRKTGRKVLELQSEYISINNVNFDSYRLLRLVELCDELGIEELEITALENSRACCFKLNEDCEFILMPVMLDYSMNDFIVSKIKL